MTYEVTFQNLLGTHTDIVQGRPVDVKKWAEKQAKDFGAEVISIEKTSLPLTRAGLLKVIMIHPQL